MNDWYIGMGPLNATMEAKSLEKCLELCERLWHKSYYKWYIVRMDDTQRHEFNVTKKFKIDNVDIVWDDYHIAPTQRQMDFKENIIFVKPLKDI